MRRCFGFSTGLLLLAASALVAAQSREDLVALFERQLTTALAQRDEATLRRVFAFLPAKEVAELLAVPAGTLRASLRPLGPYGQGTLLFLHFEEITKEEPATILQALGELRPTQQGPAVVRRVPMPEAARAFRIAAHHSTLRIEAETGATEMVDEVEIAVMRPTRWIFFVLDPGREVRAVSIEAPGAEIFRVANFVALERSSDWAVGERVHLEIVSRPRLLRKKLAEWQFIRPIRGE